MADDGAAVGNFTSDGVREYGQRDDANRLSSTIEKRLTIRLKVNRRYYLGPAREDCQQDLKLAVQ